MIFEWIVLNYIFKRVCTCFETFKLMLCIVFVALYIFLDYSYLSVKREREEKSGLNVYCVRTTHTLLQYQYVITTRMTEE